MNVRAKARGFGGIGSGIAALGIAALLAAGAVEARGRRHHDGHGHEGHGSVLPAAEFSADILADGGAKIGMAHFRQGPKGVLIALEFQDGALAPGWHGVHFHERAECGDAGFKLSGAHVGHGGQPGRHGLLNPTGPETGDLPNIQAPAAGAFGAELFSSSVALGKEPDQAQGKQGAGKPPFGGRAVLQDADGSALVIHAARDDHASQPIGGAGARVACALIK